MSKSDPESDGEMTQQFVILWYLTSYFSDLSTGLVLEKIWRGCKCFGWRKHLSQPSAYNSSNGCCIWRRSVYSPAMPKLSCSIVHFGIFGLIKLVFLLNCFRMENFSFWCSTITKKSSPCCNAKEPLCRHYLESSTRKTPGSSKLHFLTRSCKAGWILSEKVSMQF